MMMRFGRMAVAVTAMLFVAACSNLTPTDDPLIAGRDLALMAKAPTARINPIYGRYLVDDPTGEPPGTIVVDTTKRHLFYVLPDGKAMRYGVALGKDGFQWTGETTVQRKAEWPDWTPPPEMVARMPHLRPMKGGPMTPLGARALYLYKDGKDTLYRIHGTNFPDKIGRYVSSGCIRMRNIDVIDLYDRVEIGTRVIVR